MTEPEEDITFDCPYCMTENTVRIDLTGGRKQQLTHDCEICCHPIVIKLETDVASVVNFDVERELQ